MLYVLRVGCVLKPHGAKNTKTLYVNLTWALFSIPVQSWIAYAKANKQTVLRFVGWTFCFLSILSFFLNWRVSFYSCLFPWSTSSSSCEFANMCMSLFIDFRFNCRLTWRILEPSLRCFSHLLLFLVWNWYVHVSMFETVKPQPESTVDYSFTVSFECIFNAFCTVFCTHACRLYQIKPRNTMRLLFMMVLCQFNNRIRCRTLYFYNKLKEKKSNILGFDFTSRKKNKTW